MMTSEGVTSSPNQTPSRCTTTLWHRSGHSSQVRSWFTGQDFYVLSVSSFMVHRSGHSSQVRSWFIGQVMVDVQTGVSFLSESSSLKRACLVFQGVCWLRWFLIRSFVLMVCFEWQAFSLRDFVACGCSAGCIGLGCFCLLPSVLRSADSMTYLFSSAYSAVSWL